VRAADHVLHGPARAPAAARRRPRARVIAQVLGIEVRADLTGAQHPLVRHVAVGGLFFWARWHEVRRYLEPLSIGC